MNFQMVSQTFGQKDEKDYQISLKMFAKLIEIGAAKLDKNGKPFTSCKMVDDNSETHSATIRAGSKGLPTPDLLGKRCIFSLQPYQSQQGLAYSGFCNGLAAPGSYASSGQGQQAPQHLLQGTKAPQAGQFDQEKTTRLFNERQTAIKVACERYAGYMDATDEAVLKFAGKVAHFIATGELPVNHSESEKIAEGLSEPPDEPREPGQDEPPEEEKF